jgi:hypothetical protein
MPWTYFRRCQVRTWRPWHHVGGSAGLCFSPLGLSVDARKAIELSMYGNGSRPTRFISLGVESLLFHRGGK